ncbi:MAG: DUF1801 domain-containing protein [Rickettsiaceae bacterium]|nr:DUF1801 domain-containing protein [Rickettsiaceae bacterium]
MSIPFKNIAIKEVFMSYPEEFRQKLLVIRELIFTTANDISSVGTVEETLKWGEPSYVTSETNSGSTIRLGWHKKSPDQYAIYFNCNTKLIYMFKQRYGDIFKYGGNRSILFNVNDIVPTTELKDCIAMALTYKLNKKHNF